MLRDQRLFVVLGLLLGTLDGGNSCFLSETICVLFEYPDLTVSFSFLGCDIVSVIIGT